MKDDENPFYPIIRVGVPTGMSLLHVVGFKFPETVSNELQAELMAECASLFELCGGVEAGINSVLVSPNLDKRKGYNWVEVVIFATAEAFIHYHAHPLHHAFVNKVAKVADVWVVLDVPVSTGSVVFN